MQWINRLFRHNLLSVFFAASMLLTALANGNVAASQSLSNEQKLEIQKLIRETIISEPEILVDAFQGLELKKQAAAQKQSKNTLALRAQDIYSHIDDPVGGNQNGDVNFVEFFDYRCGYCKKVHETVMRLIKDDGNIRYIYKEFPILGPESVFASKAALASQEQKKYVAFNDVLMRNRGSFSKSKILKLATSIGLDTGKLEADIKLLEPKATQIFERNYSLARDLNITGTPGFIIGDTIIRGAANYETLQAAVTRSRELNETKEK